jgi:hypothetical protein
MNKFFKIVSILLWLAFLITLIIVAFFPQIHVNKETLPFTFILCLLNTLAAWMDD